MDALLERLSLAFGVLALAVILLPTARARALGGIGLALLALAAAGATVGGAGHGGAFATVNALLAVAGAAIVAAGSVLGFRGRRAPRSAGSVPEPSVRWVRPDPLLLTGMLLAAAGPQLILVALGCLLVLASAMLSGIRTGHRGWVAPPALSALLLGVATALMLTIMGPLGGAIAGLADGPFSPAAERLLVPLLGGASLLVAGIPPLHRAPWGLSLAPLGAILLVRIAAPALPGGVAEWQALAMLLLVGSLTAAGVAGRWSAVMVAGGLISLWSGQQFGQLAGCALVLWGWLIGSGVRIGGRWGGLPAAIPALCALPALESALLAQVVLPVAAVAAIVVGFGLEFRRRSSEAPQPL